MPEQSQQLPPMNFDVLKSVGLPSAAILCLSWVCWSVMSDLKNEYVNTLKEASKSYRSIAEDIKNQSLVNMKFEDKLELILAEVKKHK